MPDLSASSCLVVVCGHVDLSNSPQHLNIYGLQVHLQSGGEIWNDRDVNFQIII